MAKKENKSIPGVIPQRSGQAGQSAGPNRSRCSYEETLLHSDRGVQYRGNRYQELLQSYDVNCSMSRKGNCWDNAAIESFFSRFKVELIYAENYRSVDEARAGIFEYIELFYNKVCRHSAIDYLSPNEYEQKFIN